MKKKILIIFLTFIFTILQFSLYLKNIRVNLLLLFLIYLLFFENTNDFLIVVSAGLLVDLFSINFGSYFLSFFLVAVFLHYIYHNVLGNNKLFVYLLVNFLGLLIFYITYYTYNFFIKLINQGFYFFEWGIIWKDFFISVFLHLVFCLILYILTNIFSSRTREKFTIIGN
jgi:hypothetical protein